MTEDDDTELPEEEALTRAKKVIAHLLENSPDAGLLLIATKIVLLVEPGDDQRAVYKIPTQALVRALFAMRVADWNLSELRRRLEAAPDELVKDMGFEDSEVPNLSTLQRAWNNYFSDGLRKRIDSHATWTRGRVRELNHAIVEDLPELEPSGPEKKRPLEYRALDLVPEVLAEFEFSITDEWTPINVRSRNATYSVGDFLEQIVHLCYLGEYAEKGPTNYELTTDGGTPTGETLRDFIRSFDVDEILRRVHTTTGLLVNEAKHYPEFKRLADVAIDTTYVEYYGVGEGLEEWLWDTSGYEKVASDLAFKFATLVIVGENIQFNLAFMPVPKGLDHEHAIIVEQLLDGALNHLSSIETVYADRAFATKDVVDVLNNETVDYVIPVPQNKRIKREIAKLRRHPFRDVKVLKNHGIAGGTGSRTRADFVYTNLPIVPAKYSERLDYISFYTNKDVDDEFGLDRRETKRIVNRYRFRAGIERGYLSMKEYSPKTSSNDYRLRLFYFGFGTVVYNLWRLVDFRIQKKLEDHEVRPQPVLKQGVFLAALLDTDFFG